MQRLLFGTPKICLPSTRISCISGYHATQMSGQNLLTSSVFNKKFHRNEQDVFAPISKQHNLSFVPQNNMKTDSYGLLNSFAVSELTPLETNKEKLHIFVKHCLGRNYISKLDKPSLFLRDYLIDIKSHSGNSRDYSHSECVENLSKYLTFLVTTIILLYLAEDNVCPLGVRVGQCATAHTSACTTTGRLEQKKTTSHEREKPSEKEKISGQSLMPKDERKLISLKAAIEKSQILCKRKKEELGTPGLVVCVSVDGKQVYAEGFGYADLENETPIHPKSVLRIASISKSVTSVIIAKLWESGKIDLDKTVQHYVPDFPKKYFMGEPVDITVRQLLNHTSGIRHYKRDEDPIYAFDGPIQELVKCFMPASLSPFYSVGPMAKKAQHGECGDTKPKMSSEKTAHLTEKEYFLSANFPTTAEALKLFKDDALVGKPGSCYVYTTHGFTLLSAIVESVAKTSFTDVVTRTLDNLGLKESYLDKHGPIIYNRAKYYMKDKGGSVVNVPYVDNSYKWAGGGLLSTTEDMVKFGNILLYSAQHEDGDAGLPGYLKASTVWKFWSPPNDSLTPRYGLGFELVPDKQHYGMCGRKTFGAGHSGNAVGASSMLFLLPRCTTLNTDAMECNLSNTSTDESEPKEKRQGRTSSSMKLKCGATAQNKDSGLPQGVVVAIIVNITGVGLRTLAQDIARTFEDVDFSI